MKVYVGVTDGDWYRHLAGMGAAEVNFWVPAGRAFRVLSTGEPFVFKTRYPHNRMVGGGFLSAFVRLRVSEAWEMFGEANGVDSHARMLAKIRRYRRADDTETDPQIGCVLLRDVSFFDPGDTEPAPADFSKNLVSGRSYELSELPAEHVLNRVVFRLVAPGVYRRGDDSSVPMVPGDVFGDPRYSPYRLGQHAFQAMVLDAYGRCCSITGNRIRPVLQAAHIRPVAVGGENRLDNGLLLRSDVHTLFDRGYLAVDPRYRLRVSPRLRTDFGNGAEFYRRAGTEIAVPDKRSHRPNRDFLEWHNDEIFLAS